MKLINRIICFLILIFNLQSWSKADDITDFQIEGMSVGDSLLDYYNEEEIKIKQKTYYPRSKKYYMIEFDGKFKDYDMVAFHLRYKDEKYTIVSIKGVLFFKKKIKECMKKMDELEKNVSSFLNKPKDKNYEKEYPTKIGIANITEFNLSGGRIRLICVDFYKKIENTSNLKDNLSLNIDPNKFINWLKNEAY